MARVGLMSGAFGSGGSMGASGWGQAGGHGSTSSATNEKRNSTRATPDAKLRAELKESSTMDLVRAFASAQAGTPFYSAIRSVLLWRLGKYALILAVIAGIAGGGYYLWKGNGKRKKHRASKADVEAEAV